MVKVWDYEAEKNVPFNFQAFIGHTYPLKSIMFCPVDNNTVISCGEKDGIYIWNFYGDTQTQYAHQPIEERTQEEGGASKNATMLDKLRATRKETKKQGTLAEDSFILPSFKVLSPIDIEQQEEALTEEYSLNYIKTR